jgi:hypothetical protein
MTVQAFLISYLWLSRTEKTHRPANVQWSRFQDSIPWVLEGESLLVCSLCGSMELPECPGFLRGLLPVLTLKGPWKGVQLQTSPLPSPYVLGRDRSK